MDHQVVVVIGAGPAGLTAAYELIKRDIQPVVLEKADKVGGLARTEKYKGYRFDIGGHRFFTKFEDVQKLWQEMLGEDFLKVPRLSRIYYQGLFFNYPLAFFNTLSNLGLVESLLILLSYINILPDLHREGMGDSLSQDPSRLGGSAHQGTVAGSGGVQRSLGHQQCQIVDQRVSLSRFGAGDDVAAVWGISGKPRWPGPSQYRGYTP
jgi:uncharacterized protein with NAD-binding domain and iron-sulfur cluster